MKQPVVLGLSGGVDSAVAATLLARQGFAVTGLYLDIGLGGTGASDAAAVTKEGLRATCLAGMDPTPADYYHNVKDTADNMDRKTFSLGLDIAIEAAEIFDREGAPK